MRKYLPLVSMLSLMFSVQLAAQEIPFLWGYQWPAGGASAGLAGTGTGIGEGQAAFINNPAGLGLVKTTRFYGTISRSTLDNTSVIYGNSADESLVKTGLTNIGIAVPLPTSRGSLVLGIGYQQVRGYDYSLYGEFFDGSPGDSVTHTYTEMETGGIGRTALGGALEVAPDLFVGASLNFWSGRNELTVQESMLDTPHDIWTFSDSTAIWNIDTRLSGVNFSLSSLMNVSPGLRIGAMISSPLTLSGKEDWSYNEYWDWDDGVRTIDTTDGGEYEYRVSFPWKFRFGGSYTIGPVRLAADAELNDYSSILYKDDPPSGGTKAEANLDISRDLRNTIDYSLGAEVTIPGTAVTLRGGYCVRKNPYKESPVSKDRTLMSLGAGFRINPRLILDVAYTSASWKMQTDALVTRNDIDARNITAAFSYDL